MRGVGPGFICPGRRCLFRGGTRDDVVAWGKGHTDLYQKNRRRIYDIVMDARARPATSGAELSELSFLRKELPLINEHAWRRFCILLPGAELQEALDCLRSADTDQKARYVRRDRIYRVSVSWHDPFTVAALFYKHGAEEGDCLVAEAIGSHYCGHLDWSTGGETFLAANTEALSRALNADETLEVVVWCDATRRSLPEKRFTALYAEPQDILFISRLVPVFRDLRIAHVGHRVSNARYEYAEVMPKVLRMICERQGADAAIDMARHLVIPDSARYAFQDIPMLHAVLNRSDLAYEVCLLGKSGVTVRGRQVTDYGVEASRTVTAGEGTALETKFTRGAEARTIRIPAQTLASAGKFSLLLDNVILAGRTLGCPHKDAVDAFRIKLRAEMARLPAVRVALHPGRAGDFYHIPGAMVGMRDDAPGCIESPGFGEIPNGEELVSGKTLHLALLLGAMFWRHAAGAPAGRLKLQADFAEASRLLGQIGEIADGDFVAVWSLGRSATPVRTSGIECAADGARLAHFPQIIPLRFRDWFSHCVRCGLVGNHGKPEGKPTRQLLTRDGADLLKFMGCKLDVRVDLMDMPFLSSLLAESGRGIFRWDMKSQGYVVSCNDNRALYNELHVVNRDVYTDGLEIFVPKSMVEEAFKLAGV